MRWSGVATLSFLAGFLGELGDFFARGLGFVGIGRELDDLLPLAARGFGLAEMHIGLGEIVFNEKILGIGLLGSDEKLTRLLPFVLVAMVDGRVIEQGACCPARSAALRWRACKPRRRRRSFSFW